MTKITRTRTEYLEIEFIPQVWINDYAMNVDPLGEAAWYVTSEMVADLPPDWMENINDYEYVLKSGSPHEWVREYNGPFEFTLRWVTVLE